MFAPGVVMCIVDYYYLFFLHVIYVLVYSGVLFFLLGDPQAYLASVFRWRASLHTAMLVVDGWCCWCWCWWGQPAHAPFDASSKPLVCVLHIKPFVLLVDIKHNTQSVSALILHPREIQALWSLSDDTGRYVVPGKIAVVVQCHAVVLGYVWQAQDAYASYRYIKGRKKKDK